MKTIRTILYFLFILTLARLSFASDDAAQDIIETSHYTCRGHKILIKAVYTAPISRIEVWMDGDTLITVAHLPDNRLNFAKMRIASQIDAIVEEYEDRGVLAYFGGVW